VSPAKRRPAIPKPSTSPAPERRANHTLREVLDELVQHVRVVARTLESMTPAEIAHAQERLEWLADEVWRVATEASEPE
jgi:hypothetical protein